MVIRHELCQQYLTQNNCNTKGKFKAICLFWRSRVIDPKKVISWSEIKRSWATANNVSLCQIPCCKIKSVWRRCWNKEDFDNALNLSPCNKCELIHIEVFTSPYQLLLPSRLCFPCFCWLVGLSTEWNKYWTSFHETWWRMRLSPEQTPFTFGAGLDRGTDPETFSHFLEQCEICRHFNLFIRE